MPLIHLKRACSNGWEKAGTEEYGSHLFVWQKFGEEKTKKSEKILKSLKLIWRLKKGEEWNFRLDKIQKFAQGKSETKSGKFWFPEEKPPFPTRNFA